MPNKTTIGVSWLGCSLSVQRNMIQDTVILILNFFSSLSFGIVIESKKQHLRVLLAGSHCKDSAWRLSSSISKSRLERYCLTLRAIWASSYSFLALRNELRRTRFLCPPVCATSSTAVFVLPWLRDLG